jgi:hypothetical protein
MADLEFDGFGPDMADGGRYSAVSDRIGRLMNVAGAAMSIALIGGLGYWGYELMVRDVTGIPVVRALEGPMRVQPDDPGGDRTAHQGLAVNRIAAEGDAAPPPEEIVLAPRSADLATEDLPQSSLGGTAELIPASAVAPPPRPVDPVEAAILAAATGVMLAEAEMSGEGLIDIIPASTPGPSRSLRPRLRPEGFVLASLTVAETLPAPVAASEVDAATLAPGTRLVQFGAFDSPDEAREAWAVLGGRFGPLMADKGLVIEEAANGGHTFYRLRAAGFDDLADARRFCAAFVAERNDCIPVLTR